MLQLNPERIIICTENRSAIHTHTHTHTHIYHISTYKNLYVDYFHLKEMIFLFLAVKQPP